MQLSVGFVGSQHSLGVVSVVLIPSRTLSLGVGFVPLVLIARLAQAFAVLSSKTPRSAAGLHASLFFRARALS